MGVRFGHGSTTPVAPQMHREQQQQQQPVTRQPATSPTFSEIEQARPQTATEEELQLKLALTMSKEEAEREKMKKERQQQSNHLVNNKEARKHLWTYQQLQEHWKIRGENHLNQKLMKIHSSVLLQHYQ